MFKAARADTRACRLAIFAGFLVASILALSAQAFAGGGAEPGKQDATCAQYHRHHKAGKASRGRGRGHHHKHQKCGSGGSLSGRIVIRESTNPSGTGASFGFTAAALSASGFSLKDGQTTSFDVGAGAYTVAQGSLSGWTLKAIYCKDASGDTTVSGLTAMINVAAGETVFCVFKNAQLPPPADKGRIVITKQTYPAGSTQAFTFTAPGLSANGFSLKDTESTTFDNLTPGPFTVTENSTAGWALKAIDCQASGMHSGKGDYDHPKHHGSGPWMAHKSGGHSGGEGDHSGGADVNVSGDAVTINVAAGQTVSCAFKNKQIPVGAEVGTIVIAKLTVPAGANASFGFTAPALDADGFALVHGQSATFSGIAAGTYTVTENSASGWTLQTLGCVDGTADTTTSGATATIKVAAGETVTCTYTNAALPGVTTTPTTTTPAPTSTAPATPAPTTQTTTQSPSSGVLSETETNATVRSRAALAAPHACVRASYSLRVRGTSISKVSISVNGRHVKTVSAKNRSLIRISMKRQGARVQHVVARVSFKANASPRAKTLRTTVLRCQSVSGVLPSFAG